MYQLLKIIHRSDCEQFSLDLLFSENVKLLLLGLLSRKETVPMKTDSELWELSLVTDALFLEKHV